MSSFKQKIRDKAKTIVFEWHGSVYKITEEDLERLIGKQAIIDITHKACDRNAPNYESYPKLKIDLLTVENAEKIYEEAMAELKPLLEEISRGSGAYSRDRLTHAGNCIENMKELANKCLGMLEEK